MYGGLESDAVFDDILMMLLLAVGLVTLFKAVVYLLLAVMNTI